MKQTILLVDDSKDDIALISRALKKAGLTNPIYAVQSAKEGIHYLGGKGKYSDREHYPFPSILLLDLRMPHRDGFSVLEWIRLHTFADRLLIVVLSQLEDVKEITRAYQLGANSYLIKPGHPEDLKNLIETFHGYWITTNQPPSERKLARAKTPEKEAKSGSRPARQITRS